MCYFGKEQRNSAHFKKDNISHSKILKLVKIMSLGTGDKYWPSFGFADVTKSSTFILHIVACSGREVLLKFDIILVVFTIIRYKRNEIVYTKSQSKVDLRAEALTKWRLLALSSLMPKNLKHIQAMEAKIMKLNKMISLLPHYVHDLKAKLL